MCECEAKISSYVSDLNCFCSLAQCAKISSVGMHTGYTEYKSANGKLVRRYNIYLYVIHRTTGLQLIHISGCKEFKLDISQL